MTSEGVGLAEPRKKTTETGMKTDDKIGYVSHGKQATFSALFKS